MALLQTFITEPQNRPSTVLFQSSAAQSTLPVLSHLLASIPSTHSSFLLFALLYPPSHLLDVHNSPVEINDWLDIVPAYSADHSHPGKRLLSAVEQALNKSNAPVCVAIDSVDTLVSDIGSPAETYKWLRQTQTLLASRTGSLLILHGIDPSLISLLSQPPFASSLLHVRGHPPSVLAYLATEYLTPPPPFSPVPKFWGLFTPFSERQHTINELAYGTNPQVHKDTEEILLEIVVRRPAIQGSKKRGVERELEAWTTDLGPCHWTQLKTLRSIWSRPSVSETTPAADPTQNLSFNLTMTTAQQEARAQVPLPYAHEGEPTANSAPPIGQGVILYDPDSADDIDDDDPDEDLDI